MKEMFVRCIPPSMSKRKKTTKEKTHENFIYNTRLRVWQRAANEKKKVFVDLLVTLFSTTSLDINCVNDSLL